MDRDSTDDTASSPEKPLLPTDVEVDADEIMDDSGELFDGMRST